MIGEDGTEGYSDLFQENAMLQKENGALRLRVKAMQEAIDAINSRVTHLMSQEANLLLAKAGEWAAGQRSFSFSANAIICVILERSFSLGVIPLYGSFCIKTHKPSSFP